MPQLKYTELTHQQMRRIERIEERCEEAADRVECGRCLEEDIELEIIVETRTGDFRQFCLDQFQETLQARRAESKSRQFH